MIFPIYIKEPGTKLPEEGDYYIIARDGVYLHRSEGLIRAIVKVDRISALEEVTRQAQLRLPPLDRRLVLYVINFFRRVYCDIKTEVAVLIFYNEERDTYRVSPPDQFVSAASVNYDKSLRYPGFLLVGSIHSHANFSAFHSGTDQCDEAFFDGLHVTIGHLDDETHDISAEIAVNGNRFPVPPEAYLAGIERVKPMVVPENEAPSRQAPLREVAPRGSERSIIERVFGLDGVFGDFSFGDDLGFKTFGKKAEPELPRFRPAPAMGRTIESYAFPPMWLRRVRERSVLAALREQKNIVMPVKPDDSGNGSPTFGDEGGGGR